MSCLIVARDLQKMRSRYLETCKYEKNSSIKGWEDNYWQGNSKSGVSTSLQGQNKLYVADGVSRDWGLWEIRTSFVAETEHKC